MDVVSVFETYRRTRTRLGRVFKCLGLGLEGFVHIPDHKQNDACLCDILSQAGMVLTVTVNIQLAAHLTERHVYRRRILYHMDHLYVGVFTT